ncbi:adenylate cyclase type 5-like, partial [Stegostoma tigrinum]|uniref:adenylate cyclase type 5-like n=1 Tax=Stegostoma tigrinum TaxID=3053191 RepID=UPI002870B15D
MVNACYLRTLNYTLGDTISPCGGDTPYCSFPQYFTYSVVLALLACGVFLQISSTGKLALMFLIELLYIFLIEWPNANLFDNFDLMVTANALMSHNNTVT